MQPSQQLVLQDGSPFGFSPSPIVFVNGISERSPLMRVLKSANVERKPLGFFQGLLQDSTSVIHNESLSLLTILQLSPGKVPFTC